VTPGGVLTAFATNVTTFVPAYSLGLKRLYILLFEVGILLVGLVRYRRDRLAGLLSLIGLLWLAAGFALFTPLFRWAVGVPLFFSLAVTGRLLSVGFAAFSPTMSRILWVLALLYGANNLVGDAYVFKHNFGNTPYARLTETLDATIPDGVPVYTDMQFWFAFQRNEVYTRFTRSFANPYGGKSKLLNSGHVRYVVLSAALSRGLSPITGQTDYIHGNNGRDDQLYQQAYKEVLAHYRRITLLPTKGYGEVEIWQYAATP
jgi:hypothetical protein